MDGVKPQAEGLRAAPQSQANTQRSIVVKPAKLEQLVDILNVMATVPTRIQGSPANDSGSIGSAIQSAGAQGTSQRDAAIAKAPPTSIMQKKIVKHLRREVQVLEREVRKLKRSSRPGRAYLLNELYKKIRNISAIITRILHASTNLIRRFYISIFIDHQPFAVSGTTILGQETE